MFLTKVSRAGHSGIRPIIGALQALAWLSACGTSTRNAAAPSADAAAEDAEAHADAGGTNRSDSGVESPSDAAPETDSPDSALPQPAAKAHVFVHLFEWKWSDIARECETFLGPRGFAAVQISPPTEHSILGGYPWWQRYQTVAYDVAKSRSGTNAEFVDMVQRCAKVGVGIYVDAVINHMTAQESGVGSNGTQHSKYEYPGLFSKADFHSPECVIKGSDYANNADNVQRCELLGLSDLDTGAASVQDKIAGFLASLVELGVRGFRIDAAKHMAPADLNAILNKVNARVAPNVPYYFLEVIDPGGEAIRASDYLEVGRGHGARVDVTEFKYNIGENFLNQSGHKISELKNLAGPGSSFLPSERALVFTNNHDTQRANAIFYQDGKAHDLANVFMLAFPYGSVSIMSSYAFDRGSASGRDSGPPSDNQGHTNSIYASASSEAPNCAANPAQAKPGSWVCEHRQRAVVNMVQFRNATFGTNVSHQWDNGGNQIGFGREGKGFVVINREPDALSREFDTGMPAGTYCDVLAGDLADSGCTGGTVIVDTNGRANISVAADSAVAFHIEAKAN